MHWISALSDAAAGLGCWLGAYHAHNAAEMFHFRSLEAGDGRFSKPEKRAIAAVLVLFLVGAIEVAKALSYLPD